MPEAGLYVLTKVIAGGLSAVTTGPFGTIDLPDVDLSAKIAGNTAGYAAAVSDASGEMLGHAGLGSGYSPSPFQLPDRFIQALLSIEDTRYGRHPGVDPMAVGSAAIDTISGRRRGGSTLTQQVVKNAITGPELSLDRKIREAILAIRAHQALPHDRILQGYLANAWFGRGQHGAAGAALAWFGKDWSEIELHEAAFLAGLLKGPSYYDPVAHPERATARRNTVLARMRDSGMITETDYAVAISLPLEVIPDEEADALLEALPRWIATGIDADFARYGLTNRSDIAAGGLEVVTTINRQWQRIAEEALEAGIDRLATAGPGGHVDLGGLRPGDDLATPAAGRLREAAAAHVATTRRRGRAIVAGADGDAFHIILDRGFGALEWDSARLTEDAREYTPAPGDVLPYTREAGEPILHPVDQVQGAVVVMDPASGAILASIGGPDPEMSPFDRTAALRQPGSAIKPFLWAAAMENGMRWSDMVADRVETYATPTGETWRPRNYDRSESGLIPLFVGLEESSNLVAAHLVDRLGVAPFARVTEMAGIYDWGKMSRHPASALGASETSLTRLAAGYAAIANGGAAVTPHHVASVRHEGREVWRPRGSGEGYAVASPRTIGDLDAMLWGVTRRGTAAGALRGLDMPVAGKTGTSSGYRDAWFMSYTPDIVVGVWIGRDDATSIPGNPTGSRAAAPVARAVYEAALADRLLTGDGLRPGRPAAPNWPPNLFEMSSATAAPRTAPSARDSPFKRPLPEEAEPQATPTSGPGYLDRPAERGTIFTTPGNASEDDLPFRTLW